MLHVTASSANELLTQAVWAVLEHGTAASPRALETVELLDVNLCLTEPRRRFIDLPPARILNPAFAASETVWILSGSDAGWIYLFNDRLRQFTDDGVLQGAYGPRLRNWGGRVDQLDHVRRLLARDPDTRRAVIQLFDPARDHSEHRDVPCTLGYRFFLRGGRLDMHTSMRSQDLWRGFCYDLFTNTVLHELLAGWVGAELGDYVHHVDSLHLYRTDVPAAAATPLRPPASPPMAPLAIDWPGFDQALRQVVDDDCPPPALADFATVMRSYRRWKTGDQAAAVDLVASPAATGTLSQALGRWYDHLRARRAEPRAEALP